METANNQGDVEKIENISKKAKKFSENINKTGGQRPPLQSG